MVAIRARVGSPGGTGLVYGRNIGSGYLRPTDTVGIIGRWKAFLKQVQAVVPRATKIALYPTFELSKIYCPKKTGALVYSGYLEITGRFNLSGQEAVVEIGYGKGGNPPYALAVHEIMERYHKPPTRAKWLEVAMRETQNKILGRIASQLRIP